MHSCRGEPRTLRLSARSGLLACGALLSWATWPRLALVTGFGLSRNAIAINDFGRRQQELAAAVAIRVAPHEPVWYGLARLKS